MNAESKINILISFVVFLVIQVLFKDTGYILIAINVFLYMNLLIGYITCYNKHNPEWIYFDRSSKSTYPKESGFYKTRMANNDEGERYWTGSLWIEWNLEEEISFYCKQVK